MAALEDACCTWSLKPPFIRKVMVTITVERLVTMPRSENCPSEGMQEEVDEWRTFGKMSQIYAMFGGNTLCG
jgi:hypothetical protein